MSGLLLSIVNSAIRFSINYKTECNPILAWHQNCTDFQHNLIFKNIDMSKILKNSFLALNEDDEVEYTVPYFLQVSMSAKTNQDVNVLMHFIRKSRFAYAVGFTDNKCINPLFIYINDKYKILLQICVNIHTNIIH